MVVAVLIVIPQRERFTFGSAAAPLVALPRVVRIACRKLLGQGRNCLRDRTSCIDLKPCIGNGAGERQNAVDCGERRDQRTALVSKPACMVDGGVCDLDPRAGNKRLQGNLGFLIGEDFKGERGDAVAEIGKLQVFEHDIGAIAKCRGFAALVRRDKRIDRIIPPTAIDPKCAFDLEIAIHAAQQVAVCPDPSDANDRRARQGDGERCGITVGRGLWLSLPTFGGRAFIQFSRPDHCPGDPHSAKDARDRLAVAGGGDRKLLYPRPLASAVAEHPPVDLASYEPADRSAKRSPQRASDDGED